MSDRRHEVLEAALQLLAGGGTKALTHRAIDRELRIPLGSTANYYPTRRALEEAILEELERRDAVAYARIDGGAVTTERGAAARRMAKFIRMVVEEPLAVPTRARLALGVGGVDTRARHASLFPGLVTLLRRMGVAEPVEVARAVSAYLDGLALHHLTLGVPLDEDEITRTLSRMIDA
ncbi:TetR/AcrR family transcriptional regulator [Arsenicicoccus sp. oral taxon 190]|uniref:TetR/AcrR family transcriptional regulator n=1 Tax=Arsenicicoccus sp. oral taxon 190 TaxID=1658671 RepID=UPI000679FD4E|nr:hypothetical protein [Arsenicicoccus sp. oral taxon 190]AKT50642.1 hypothetical protein ADJ73_03760 [Arsenicicoccus sp. oral taxon 190]